MKSLAHIPSETTHATHIASPFDASHLITIPLQLNGVTSYFDERKPIQEEYENNSMKMKVWKQEYPQDWTHGRNFTMKSSSPEFSGQEQSMDDCRGWFICCNTPASGQLFINSVNLYDYDAADVMEHDNYATVLESLVNTLWLHIAQVDTEKVSWHDHLFIAKKWGISPKKALNMICHTTQCGVKTVMHPSLSRQLRTNDHQL